MNHEFEMRWDLVNLIVKGLRDHFPVSYRPRRNIFKLMPAGNLQGDFDGTISAEILDRVMEEFRAMPEADRRRVLNGWSQEALKVNHTEWLKWMAGRPIMPCLSVQCSPGMCSGPVATLYGDFTAMDADKGPVHVQIRVGLSKRDAIESLDRLKEALDEEWDRIVADPLNEQARAAREGNPVSAGVEGAQKQ